MDEKRPRFCHLCGTRLFATYFVYETGLVVCERCERMAPHCDRCRLPSLKLTNVRGSQVCPACLRTLPVCACCRIPILGRYHILGDSPARYCETCMQERPRCDICRAPLDERGKILRGSSGDIYRCATCFSQAVTDGEEARRLYLETAALLRRELHLEIAPIPALHLVERAALNTLHSQVQGFMQHATPTGLEQQHLLGFFQRVDQNWDIYIEHYLPRTLFQAVAAHELAHAWQSIHAERGQEPKIVEGFAEWVAYRTMLLLGEQRAAARLTRRSDLYGEGLQYFIALERQHGRDGLLRRAALRYP